MGRIKNWSRVFWRSTTDENVRREIEETGSAEIAKWRFKDTDIRCVHTYEPEAEEPYLVELRNTDLDPVEAGRYRTRKKGGDANKKLMRENTDILARPKDDFPTVRFAQDKEDWLRADSETRRSLHQDRADLTKGENVD